MNRDTPDVDYVDVILEHFESSPFRGELTSPDVSADKQHSGCSDHVHVSLRISSQGVVTTARFTGSGCTISMAGASIACEAVEGRSMCDVLAMDRRVLEAAIGPGAVAGRPRCAMLGLTAIQEALAHHRRE